MIGGSFVVVAVVGILVIAGLSQTVRNAGGSAQDERMIQEISRIYSSKADPQAQIDLLEPIIAKLTQEANRSEQTKNLAVLYEQVGLGQMNNNDFTHAEASFSRANVLDPDNPKLMSDLGSLYLKVAPKETTPDSRIAFYGKSIDEWESAATAATDRSDRAKYLEEEGDVCLQEASELVLQGKRSEAAQVVRTGLDAAPAQSKVHKSLSELNDRIHASG